MLNMIVTNQLYKNPLLSILAVLIAASIAVSCSHSQKQAQIISDAERIAYYHPDSALSILDIIEPSELSVDSLKAQYYLLKALIHDKQGHLQLSDSLIGYSADYYKHKDINRAIKSATLSALYNYWVNGDRNAIVQLDSLANLANLPDSLAIFPLRKRAYWSTKLFDEKDNRPVIKRLISIDKDSASQHLYKYWLYIDYLFDGQTDSSLIILDELIGQAISSKLSEHQFKYEYEKMGALEESGHYAECLELADKFLEKAPGNSIEHYIHLWKSLALLNMGNRNGAIRELAKADSCAASTSEDEKGYYNSFSYLLNTVLDYQNTGKLRLIRMAQINNRQKDYLFRTQSLQHEAEQSAFEIENRRLILKARNDRQTAILIIVVLAAIIISGSLLWYALHRKRKAVEALERNEVLQKLIDESDANATNTAQSESLRRAMLQQLGIIKMVAETPTEQNRDMLRKISSIDSDTQGALVNWESVYAIIDNLYSGFYTRLHKRHGDILTDKEEQIIVLISAGFSTKEISVITGQTSATIYVRKSSIRKKLGVPEKEDIVAFLRQEAND